MRPWHGSLNAQCKATPPHPVGSTSSSPPPPPKPDRTVISVQSSKHEKGMTALLRLVSNWWQCRTRSPQADQLLSYVEHDVERGLDRAKLGVEVLDPPSFRLERNVRADDGGNEPADFGELLPHDREFVCPGARRCRCRTGGRPSSSKSGAAGPVRR